MATNIDDLNDFLVVEILCRLSFAESIVRSKCVSKRWCALISDSYFIGRFSRLQSDKLTQRTHCVVDSSGNELFPTKVFERFRRSLCSEKKSGLLATCNDLVLGVFPCEGQNHRDYFICNPRTMQLVSLPPTPRLHERPPWGFICEPYYNEDSNGSINVNAEYRCKVVRILRPRKRSKKCFKFNIEVFSSETGEWREIVVPCPQGFRYFDIRRWDSFGKYGILYWVGEACLLALRTPLMINSKMNGTSYNVVDDDDQYQFHVIEIDLPASHSIYNGQSIYPCQLHYIGVYGGRLRLQDCNLDVEPPLLCVWELKEEELDQMVVEGTRKLGSDHMKSYLLDRKMLPAESFFGSVVYLAYDLNDFDVVYASVDEDLVKCNIQTGSWSKIAKTPFDGFPKQFVLPWWPTPVPRLEQRSL